MAAVRQLVGHGSFGSSWHLQPMRVFTAALGRNLRSVSIYHTDTMDSLGSHRDLIFTSHHGYLHTP